MNSTQVTRAHDLRIGTVVAHLPGGALRCVDFRGMPFVILAGDVQTAELV